jgi:hypothetical protein
MTDEHVSEQDKEDDELGVNLLQTSSSIGRTLKKHLRHHLKKTRKMN